MIKDFCSYVTENPPTGGHSIAANKGGAIALAQPKRTVVCLDGDGALFMHLGALALIPTLGAGIWSRLS